MTEEAKKTHAFAFLLSSGCTSCPFEHDATCIVEADIKTVHAGEPAPEDCPVRQGPVVVVAKEESNGSK